VDRQNGYECSFSSVVPNNFATTATASSAASANVYSSWYYKMSETHESQTYRLVGRQLSAISFEIGFMELWFDDSIVRAMSDPLIEIAGQRFEFPNDGARDALCSLLGQTVSQVMLFEDERFILKFGPHDSVAIPLGKSSVTGESMHYLSAPNRPLEVFL
jgi:hypothetical protein